MEMAKTINSEFHSKNGNRTNLAAVKTDSRSYQFRTLDYICDDNYYASNPYKAISKEGTHESSVLKQWDLTSDLKGFWEYIVTA